MRRGYASSVALLLSIVAVTAAPMQAPRASTVIGRMERYVEAYEPDLSTLVARERYTQSVNGFRNDPPARRTLLSDFLFLRLPGRDGPWLGFRDVLEVDGSPVEGHEERLREIVAASPEDAATRAYQMSRESARYNLGNLRRTVNVPVCVVGWMHPRLRDHFAFSHEGDEIIGGTRTWRFAFRERKRPTVVRDHLGKDVVSFGFVWVDPDDGRILQTQEEHRLDVLRVRILVQFQKNDTFGILVPVRMAEQYLDDHGRLETEAVYSDYRRFSVTTRIR